MSHDNHAVYPRIATHIRLHARRRPLSIAVMRNGAPVTYATLDQDLRRMTAAVAAYGVAPGAIAAISHDDLYIQLLLVYACESLGIVTGSYRPVETHECANLLAAAAIVFAQNPVGRALPGRFVALTQDLLAGFLAAPVPAAIAMAAMPADAPLVIFRSSGTTGSPKLMLQSYRILNNRLARQRRRDGGLKLHRQARFLAIMHLSVGSIYMGAASCLRLGATFMFDTGCTAAQAVAELQPTHTTILPYHLRQLLQRLPPAGTALPDLVVQSIGARLPEDLRGMALQKLCGRLFETYGTNEIGSVGEVDGDGLVTLNPYIEAQITDQDRILPAGEIGVLRLRAATMVTAYLNNPDASAQMFRDGWFYPGDLAALLPGGKLRLIGRRDDVLNLGGIKTAAADLEARIQAYPGLLDVALIQPRTLGDSMRVTVCVVVPRQFDLAAFIAAIRPIIDYPFVVKPVPEIPRTVEGKIKHAALQDDVFDPRPQAPARHLETAMGSPA